MKVNSIDLCNCHSGVDEMINEGLGGGFIIYEYDKRKLEPTEINAIYRNYQLVLEKTHEITPSITKDGGNGSQSSFL